MKSQVSHHSLVFYGGGGLETLMGPLGREGDIPPVVTLLAEDTRVAAFDHHGTWLMEVGGKFVHQKICLSLKDTCSKNAHRAK